MRRGAGAFYARPAMLGRLATSTLPPLNDAPLTHPVRTSTQSL
jgi:hypothetical protein